MSSTPFKASYRRKYVREMVRYFNEHQNASLQLDVLEEIYLIAEAREELPRKVIYHCQVKAGILPCLGKDSPGHTVKPFEEYVRYLQTGIRIGIRSLIRIAILFRWYPDCDDDDTDPSIPAPII